MVLDLSFDSSLDEPDAEEGALELWSLEPDDEALEGLDDELGEPELGMLDEPDELDEPGLEAPELGLLELLLPDIDPDGDDGLVAPPEALPERDAPVELPPPVRSQP